MSDNKPAKTTLGQYIRKLREDKRWSQRDLEKKSQVDQGTISKIERDETSNPGLDTILSLAKVFKVHPMSLIFAFQGQDPDISQEEGHKSEAEDLGEAILDFLESRKSLK